MGFRPTALAATALLAGCSFFVQGPPDNYDPARQGAPLCNSSIGGRAALDVLGALWGVTVTAIAVGESREGNDDARGFVVVGAVGTAIHLAALPVGFARTARCGRAREQFISWAGLRDRRFPVVYLPPPPSSPPAPPPRPLSPSCADLRRSLAGETDPPKRFDLIRQIRARCDAAPSGAAPAGAAATPG
jgi:hypothetical protein